MKNVLNLFVFVLFLQMVVSGQAPRTFTSSEILLKLKKLNTLGSVLYIAAHPDDENTRLLSWLANEKLYRTAYLSITRGDGGQNLIGNEQGVELGLIRTQELLAARRIDGAEQFFTCAYDFGYSKSPDETLNFWDKEKVLADVVWVIRKFRPDIIITRFPTTGEGGHGHHTASAILAEEAFDAAGDPDKFSEQFKYGVSPWKPQRLLWNTFNFGSSNTQREDQFKLDVGQFNPLLGKSYGELAALSRSQHKSQGFGVPAQRGSVLEYFSAIRGTPPTYSLMEGIDISWNRTGQRQAEQLISGIIKSYDVNNPAISVPDLVSLYSFIESSQFDDFWKKTKLDEIKQLILICSGLFMEASVATGFAVRGDSLRINAVVNARAASNLSSASVNAFGRNFAFEKLAPNTNSQVTIPILIPGNAPLSQPYWLEQAMGKGRFIVADPLKVGKPESDPLSVTFRINIEARDFEFESPVFHKFTDPVKGEQLQPLVITDPVNITARDAVVLVDGNIKKPMRAEIKALKTVELLPGEINKGKKDDLRNVISGKSVTLNKDQKMTLPDSVSKTGLYQLAVKTASGIYTNELRSIEYDHIPFIHYHKPAVSMAFDGGVKRGGVNKIGYINGAGDKVPEALLQMGYSVEYLGEDDLLPERLREFDAIVTGVRAYNTNNWLYARNAVLLDYVRQGGNLVCQYNTNSWAGPAKGNFGPYPFQISRNRITEENAEVRFLTPDHPVLNTPNKISARDFEGWVQERSIYHADNTDSNFQKILAMHDAGEKDHDGSLIVAAFGKGNFIYTGLSFFRQLPAGVPGAYRLFANMLASPKNRLD